MDINFFDFKDFERNNFYEKSLDCGDLVLDFSFLKSNEVFDFYKNGDMGNNSLFFSSLFFFNSLQVDDYSFLHRDFYFFYPILKFINLCDILSKGLTKDDLLYMRNCLYFNDFLDFEKRSYE